MFDQSFIDEIVTLALQIAKLQRNEEHLQSCDILFRKFKAEEQELAETSFNLKWDEIPDIVYYATCLLAQGENHTIDRVEHVLLPLYNVTVAQAKAATLAKHRRRAAGYIKDIEAERAAILAAIENLSR